LGKNQNCSPKWVVAQNKWRENRTEVASVRLKRSKPKVSQAVLIIQNRVGGQSSPELYGTALEVQEKPNPTPSVV